MAKNDWIDHINNNYMTPLIKGSTLTISSIKDTIVLNPQEGSGGGAIYYNFDTAEENKITVTVPNGTVTTIATDINSGGSISLTQSGLYSIRYIGHTKRTFGGTARYSDFSIRIELMSVANEEPLPKWTITDVIERLLDVHETHLESEQPKYHLNAAQAEEFSKIEAPEFAFTRMTLREALDQVGAYIHGMARLRGDEIYYDMLGGTEQATLADPKYPYIAHKIRHDVESYATRLDANVDNFVNILDVEGGVITEPYTGGYKTVRSEEAYARITDGNMIISTSLPIYSISKIEVGPLPNGSQGGDITPYVFEAAEYGAISSFEGIYPNSKAYAIYYTQGQKNIKGLSFKSPSVIGGAGSKYAISNIIKEVTGYDITPDWWSTLVNGEEVEQNYPKLSFRVTYTPIFSSRVQEHKLYYKDMKQRTLAYNQGANFIESRSFGENMRGTIARTGNAELTRTYRLATTKLIPKVGQLWGDDYYVNSVAVSISPLYINCTIELSKDFNRLSKYIGINSSRRFYEVSEKQAYDRDIAYSDYIIIGDPEESDGLQMLNNGLPLKEARGAALDIRNTFYQAESSLSDQNRPVSGVSIMTYDKDNTQVGSVTLPVVSTAMGNTMVFSFYMEDNYSAGKQSRYSKNGEVGGWWQMDVPYCDYYGRFETMSVYFGKTGTSQAAVGGSPASMLPQGTYVPPGLQTDLYTITNPRGNRLKVRKNNTETIRMHYQVHYVTNRKNIIVGPALTHNCPLVRGVRTGHSAALYVLQKKIGRFDSAIDLSSSTLITDYSSASGIDVTHDRMTFTLQNATVDGVAWAIVDKATGELLYGANEAVTSGTAINLPSMTFTHKLNYKEN